MSILLMGDFNKKKKIGVFTSKKKLKNRPLYCPAHAGLANLMGYLVGGFLGNKQIDGILKIKNQLNLIY